MTLHHSVVLSSLVALALTAGCHRDHSARVPRRPTVVHGSGILAEEDRPLVPFREVEFAARGQLRITSGVAETLHLVGEDNLLPFIETGTWQDVLSFRVADGLDLVETWPIEFDLTAVDLDRIEMTGVGDVVLDRFARPDLSLGAVGVGTLRCPDLTVARLDVTVDGLGKAELAGGVDTQLVTVTGFGDYDGDRLDSRVAHVTVAEMGVARLCVRERLVVRIGDGCVVYLRGDPIIESTISGTGRLVRTAP